MFREMRLKEQQLSIAETEEILKSSTSGVLCINGVNGYPYGVPISYAYDDGKIYFHGSREGQKAELMKADPHVSFTVIAKDDIIPEAFNTLFLSVIVFGTVRLVEDTEEMKRIHGYIVDKYSRGHESGGEKYLKESMSEIYMGEITIEHMTGKKGV